MELNHTIMQTNSEYDSYQKASKKVKEIKGFYIHLFTYLVIIPVIVFINLRFSPQYYWFFYPMIGWGFGLLGHGLGVFGTDSLFSKDWEERKIKQFMEEEKKKNTFH